MLFADASLSGHIEFSGVGDMAEGTQADAAATDAYAPSRATNIIQEDGDCNRNASFSGLTYSSDGVT